MKNLILVLMVGMFGFGCATEGELSGEIDVTPYDSLLDLSAEVFQLRIDVDLLKGDVVDLSTADSGFDSAIGDMEDVLAQASFATHHDVNSSVEGCSVSYGDSSLWYASTEIEVQTPCVILINSGDEVSDWTVAQYSEFDNCGEAYGFYNQIFIVDGKIQVQAGYENTDPFWSTMEVAVVPLSTSY